MSLDERTPVPPGTMVAASQGEGFHLGLQNGEISLIIEAHDGKYHYVGATPKVARDIAATLNELADEVEADE